MTAEQLKISMRKELIDELKKRSFESIGKEIARELLRIMWERTDRGIDIHGRRWRKYSAKGYEKLKKRMGLGKDDWIKLTGALRNDLKVEYKSVSFLSNKIVMKFNYDIPEDQKKKVKGLLSTRGVDRNGETYPKSSYEFLGMSLGGGEKAKEYRRITRILKKNLNIK